MGMLKEFKTFAMRGNVVDMAVGIVIGGAFGKIVTSLVSNVIMPPVGMITAGYNFQNLKVILKQQAVDAAGSPIAEVAIGYGAFVNTVVDFVIIAFCIFLVVKAMNYAKKKEEAKPAPPAPSKEEQLLSEIRDILKVKA
ncbi:MAG TPA: large-conductance mechanosensitive channel protein MscL [Sedimentisphaerales bacterium]|nr:large-conductance mechanosensitive channel protein MscL [Sedimentisphaerales bacterium]